MKDNIKYYGELIEQFNDLHSELRNFKSKTRFNGISEHCDKFQKILDKLSKTAKGLGTICGCNINEPIADGSALYIIMSTTKNKIKLECIPFLDGYVIPYWGEKPSLDRPYVEQKLKQQDNLKKIFS